MKRRDFLAGGSALAAAAALPAGAETSATAAAELTRACGEAAASGRRLLLVFHASWCVYCRLLDMALESPEAGAAVAPHFMVLHMRVMETSKRGKAMQLRGADKVFDRYAPEGVGLPYFAALDGQEAKLSDSIARGGENIGFPVDPHELDAFEAMLRAAAPAMTAEEAAAVRQACVRVARKSR